MLNFLTNFLVVSVVLALAAFFWFASGSIVPPILVIGLAVFLYLSAHRASVPFPTGNGRDEEE